MQICKLFPIKKGTFDQWSGGFALQQLLYQSGLQQIQMNTYGPVVNSITFDLFQTLMRDKKLRLLNCQAMIEQMLSLQCQNVRNNKKVKAPQQEGYHDDIFDAVSRAIHLCYNSTQRVYRKVTTGVGTGVMGSNIQASASYHTNQIRKIKQHGYIQTRDVNYQTFLNKRGI